MAVIIKTSYAKRLGLPGYSSHEFRVSIETELSDLSQLSGSVDRIYGILQGSVDHEIQQTGFVPDANYGKSNVANVRTSQNGGNWHQSGGNGNENSSTPPQRIQNNQQWACSEKQKSLIQKLIKDHDLDVQEIEGIAFQRFNTGLQQLNKLQASGLISELIETYGHSNGNGRERSSGQQSLPLKGGQR